MIRFLKWAVRGFGRFLLALVFLPIAVPLLIVTWPIIEILEAYGDAKRRGDA